MPYRQQGGLPSPTYFREAGTEKDQVPHTRERQKGWDDTTSAPRKANSILRLLCSISAQLWKGMLVGSACRSDQIQSSSSPLQSGAQSKARVFFPYAHGNGRGRPARRSDPSIGLTGNRLSTNKTKVVVHETSNSHVPAFIMPA